MPSNNILGSGSDISNSNKNTIKTDNDISKALVEDFLDTKPIEVSGLDESSTQAHGASHLNDLGYYENYNSFYDLNMMLSTIENMNIPKNIIEEIKNIDGKIGVLCLGSATTKNIVGIAKIDEFFRDKESIENDEVHIIDINQKSIDIHQKAINDLDAVSDRTQTIEREEAKKHGLIYPQYKVSLGDVRKISQFYPKKSATIIVSDYTFNYLTSIEDIKKTFLEVNHALTSKGIFILSIQYSKKDLLPNQMEEEMKEGNVKIYKTQLEKYLEASEEAGLENVVMQNYGNNATIVFKQKS